jgi:hypothetical protein
MNILYKGAFFLLLMILILDHQNSSAADINAVRIVNVNKPHRSSIFRSSNLTIVDPVNGTVASVNVTGCFGNTNGSISINSSSGGSGLFEYTINGGSSWVVNSTFTSLNAGTYNVQIRDAQDIGNSKILNSSLVITQPAQLSATVNSSNASSCTVSDGSITLSSPAGGSGTYEYKLGYYNPWVTSASFTGLANGAYEVKIRDAANPSCEKVLNGSLVIGAPGAVSASLSNSNVTSCGGSDGSISVTGITGGSGTYEYSKNDGQSWQSSASFTGLSAGNYNVKARDKNNISCVWSNGMTISQPSDLSATFNYSAATTCSSKDASITIISSSGGSGAYEYSINFGYTWTTDIIIANLSGGNYGLQLRDKNNPSCFKVESYSIDLSGPGSVSANYNVNDVTTCGGTDGSVTFFNVTGGSGTYEYSKDGITWQSGNSFTNLSAGGFSVSVRDKNNPGCAWSNWAYINQPSDLNASYTSSSPSGCSSSDGSITITSPSGGSGAYEYSLNGGYSWQGSGSFTNLGSQYYSITIRDKNSPSCFKELANNIQLSGPGAVTAQFSINDATTCGGSDGKITLSNATGGSGQYEYSINNGDTWQTSGSYTGLNAGNFNLKVRDKNNPTCYWQQGTTVGQPSNLNASYSSSPPTGCSSNDGSITVTSPTGGSGVYEYSINYGYSWEATGSYTSISGGHFSILIRDKNNASCFKELANNIDLNGPGAVTANFNVTDATTCGGSDGKIIFSGATGGSGTFEYSIDGGNSWQASDTFNNLTAGGYNLKARDKNNPGCYWSDGTMISQPSNLSASYTSSVPTSCAATDGTITFTSPSGGSGVYEYTINNGNTWQSSGAFTNLSGMKYSIAIRDKNNLNCFKYLNNNLNLLGPGAISFMVNSTDVSACGGSDGSLTINNATGGSGVYEHSKDEGVTWQTGATFSGLTQGSYEIRVRDKNNISCYAKTYYYIGSPGGVDASVTSENTSACGVNDGKITVSSPSGGGGMYEYSIDGGTSWQSNGIYTGLKADEYNVRIRDKNNTGCYRVLASDLRIEMPVQLSADVSADNITSCGANDGKITLSNPTGGSGQYEYSINGGISWTTTSVFSGLLPGSYNAAMRDKNAPLCMTGGTLILTAPAQVMANVTSTNVTTCYGNNNATISITSPSGGGGTYQYSIDGGSTWQSNGSYTNVVAGTYDVRIRDAANTICVSILASGLTVSQPAQLSATTSKTDVVCNGASTGSITISSSTGGAGTYEYSKDGGTNWQSGSLFTSLAADTYNVKIRDAANTTCSVTLNGTLSIIQPSVLSAVVTPKNISCNGANDGSIAFSTITGGAGTYEFSKNGGTSWENVTGYTALAPATYNVKIRDAVNTTCTVTLNGTLAITQPALLAATFTGTNATSCLNNDGKITITGVSGGYGTYEYSKDNGSTWQSTTSYTSLASGSYTAKVRDADNTSCMIGSGVNITKPADVSASITPSNVTVCYGNNNGSIALTSPTGGGGTYQYSVDGGINWQSGATFSGLTAKSYDVRVRDANSITCVTTINSNVSITQPVQLSATTSKTDVVCNGSSTGSITISSSAGGAGTYQYSKDGGTNWQSGSSFTSLAAGTYNVKIRDAVNTTCSVTLNATLSIIQPSVLAAVVTSKNISCNGANDGSIAFSTITGGAGTYEFSKNGGTSWENVTSYTALAPATYNVKIRDAVNTTCIVTLNGALAITQPALLAATFTGTNATSCLNNDGKITITGVSGGYGTYEYSKDNGATWQSTTSYTSLASGSYTAKVRDADNTSCMIGSGVNITKPADVSASVTSVNATCFGVNGGSITLTSPAGGSGTYQYTIDGGVNWQSGATFSGLTAKSYDVRVRDANSITCATTINGSITITQPAQLSGIPSKVDVSCNGSSNGSITISNSAGGAGTYQYSKDGGTSWQNGDSFTGLGAGTYNVKLRDAVNTSCVVTLNSSMSVSQPLVLAATITTKNISCNGVSDGSITFSSPTGGLGTYEFSINGGSSWEDVTSYTSLAADTYSVKIRDAVNNNCIVTLNGTLALTQPAVLAATVGSSNATSCSNNDGAINITGATGGSGTFEYSINNGTSWSSSGSFVQLSSGNYNVSIRDLANKECVVSKPIVTISAPDQITATLNSTNVSLCFGASNGSIAISSPSGGSSSFEYSKDGGTTWQTSGSFSALPEGTYDVRMRDANSTSCTTILNSGLKVTQPTQLKATVTLEKTACKSNTGSISITSATGGSGNYEYSIDGGTSWITNAITNALPAGVYKVYMRDASSTTCVETINDNAEIVPVMVLDASSTSTDVNCNGGNDGSITITATGGSSQYEYSADGGVIWNDNNMFTNLSAKEYTLMIRDKSDNTCDIIVKKTIAEPIALKINTKIDSAANTIEVEASGGTAPYVYQVGDQSFGSNNVFTNITKGKAYLFTIKDANNCTVSKSDSINLITAIREFGETSSLQIYPIPAKDDVEIIMPDANFKHCEISIVNAWGVSVYKTNVKIENNTLHRYVNVRASVKGVYTVIVKTENKIFITKMVLQ